MNSLMSAYLRKVIDVSEVSADSVHDKNEVKPDELIKDIFGSSDEDDEPESVSRQAKSSLTKKYNTKSCQLKMRKELTKRNRKYDMTTGIGTRDPIPLPLKASAQQRIPVAHGLERSHARACQLLHGQAGRVRSRVKRHKSSTSPSGTTPDPTRTIRRTPTNISRRRMDLPCESNTQNTSCLLSTLQLCVKQMLIFTLFAYSLVLLSFDCCFIWSASFNENLKFT
ncbi:hypothetical protein HELRODRAFT_193744 [Helobdella robusta]|uniref:Uncharacterized protein n=1 Tax=Helobdella robusta TaxID=6412 RepID=T1FVB1_HELRO|nr:hypothetical protein HELRODRAFT_193744 [Helobdella robusta]ESN94853.1 hypothetical protein HELRODRAFT_193744 [Helobdella robusta]